MVTGLPDEDISDSITADRSLLQAFSLIMISSFSLNKNKTTKAKTIRTNRLPGQVRTLAHSAVQGFWVRIRKYK